MSNPVNIASNGSISLGSERLRLARVARDAALRIPGVVGTDTGPIGMAERVLISADTTAGELHDALARLGADLMMRALGAVELAVGGAAGSVGGGERLEGVMCVATKNGGYEVTLRLVCAVVSLPNLGEQVKAAVAAMAAEAGIPVDSVSVHVAAVAGTQEW